MMLRISNPRLAKTILLLSLTFVLLPPVIAGETAHFHNRALRSFGRYGTGGNKVVVFPDESLVVVITTTNYRVQGAGALTDKLIMDYILKAAAPGNAQ